MGWTQVLTIPAIVAVGVVYGTDMFFAVVARPALGHVSAASLTEVMGRLHEKSPTVGRRCSASWERSVRSV